MTGNLIDIASLSRDDIERVLNAGVKMKRRLIAGEKSEELKNRAVITLFYENSTRTRISFETAAKFLGAEVINVPVEASSVKKGESFIDTARTLDMLCPDLIVMRHGCSGAPQLLARHVSAKIINAGDGLHAHPTQALLDMFTIRERYGKIEGLKVAIVGDIKHSRVARSDIEALSKYGVTPRVYGPATLVPEGLLKVERAASLEEAAEDADVVIALRIQLERQKSGLFSGAEYASFYGVSERVMSRAKRGAVIMHPGPVNRGVEIGDAVLKSAECLKDEQVKNGLAVRMAVIRSMIGEQL